MALVLPVETSFMIGPLRLTCEHLAFADFIPGMNLDSVRAVFAARTGGAFDNYDIDDVLIEFPGTGPPCDFDSDGLCNTVDIDLLGKVIIAGTNDPSFDVNGDGVPGAAKTN